MHKTFLLLGLLSALAACATTSGSHGAPSAGFEPPADARKLIVDGATAMLGQPYRYGGAAPGGFDCSGLVVYAAGAAGIPMPRTAQEQLRAGTPIVRRELQAGDLVFMHLTHKELHVGIAVDHQRFVHAPSAGGHVRINSLDAPPYARGFMAARRIVAAPSAIQ